MNQKAIDGLVSDHEIWFKENDKGSKLSLSDKKIEGGFRTMKDFQVTCDTHDFGCRK